MNKLKLSIIVIALLPAVSFSHQNLGTTIISLDKTTVIPGETIEVVFKYTINNPSTPHYELPQWKILIDSPYTYYSGSVLSSGGDVHSVSGELTFDVTSNIIIPAGTEPGTHSIDVWTSATFWWDTALSSAHIDITVVSPVQTVDIDVKPGSYPNSINLGSNGVVPVAILSSETFDATTVDPDTVELAGSGVAVRGKGNKFLAHIEDINCDGKMDLVCQVETENLDPDLLQDGVAILTGSTYGGQEIEGQDDIILVPPQ